jgi:Fur family transcriptional regulator, ferric uptake regulator
VTADLQRIVQTRLRKDGQRYNENRRAVVDLLAARGPMTIPEILTARADLAQSSVYRNLSVLERANVVRRIVTHDEWARYELDEDLTGHHHHLICSSCGTVSDFTLTDDLEHSIDAAFTKVARRSGFRLEQHRLDLVGLCRDCV